VWGGFLASLLSSIYLNRLTDGQIFFGTVILVSLLMLVFTYRKYKSVITDSNICTLTELIALNGFISYLYLFR
jgi:uncharacterized membrane protein